MSRKELLATNGHGFTRITKSRRVGEGFLAVTVCIMATAAEIGHTQSQGLTAHEWGTFTSVAGKDGNAIEWNVLGDKDDLPGFVVNPGYRRFKFRLAGTVRMETPVLYFYSPREVTARVNVQFPHGVITEWYPKGDNAIYESKSMMDRTGAATGSRIYSDDAVHLTKSLIDPPPTGLDLLLVKLGPSLNGLDTSLRNLMSAISWSDIKIQPGSTPDLPDEKGASHYYAARTTDAAPVTVGDQHEKFLFYRGVGRIQVPLSARISPDGKIVVANTGSDIVPMALLFENQAGRLGFTAAGMLRDSITLDRPQLTGVMPQLAANLENALVSAGLFPKEAHAMVETWRDSWFEEGTRLIYIVPPHLVDALLPLQVEPAPVQTTRVFVGRMELITPEIKRSVEDAMANNDYSVVSRYGRFLEPILQQILMENPASINDVNRFRTELGRAMAGTSGR